MTDDVYAISEEAKKFGLFGNFPGDQNLLSEIQTCRDAVEIAPTIDQIQRIVSLLERLPFSGRNAFTIQVLAKSPHRDALFLKLFEYCLLHEDDGTDSPDAIDDFVVLLTDSTILLDMGKYHILRVVLLLIGFCQPSVAVKVSRVYLRSASTRYQGDFLSFCAKLSPKIFGDDELFKFYQESPTLVQKGVLATCKRQPCAATPEELQVSGNPAPARQEFFVRVLENAALEPDLIFWCSSAHLKTRLKNDSSFFRTLGLRRWTNHAPIYLNHIRGVLLAEPSFLRRGEIWASTFGPALAHHSCLTDLKPCHVHALKDLLEECQVLVFQPGVPANVRVYVQDEQPVSANLNDYEGVVQKVKMQPIIMTIIPKKERTRASLEAIQNQDWDTFERYKHTVKFSWMPFSKVFSDAAPMDLWNVLTRKSHIYKQSAKDKIFRYFITTDFTNNKKRSFTIDTLQAWKDLHLRSTPLHLTAEQRISFFTRLVGGMDQDSEDEVMAKLWQNWYESLTQRYISNGHMEEVTRRVLVAKQKHRPQERSPITLDARYAHELLDFAMQGIDTLFAAKQSIMADTDMVHQLHTLLGLYGALRGMDKLEVVSEFNKRLEKIILDRFVPRLADMLHFDPKGKNYITRTVRQAFQQKANWLALESVRSPSNQSVIRALLERVLEPVSKQASAAGRNIPLPNGLSWFEAVEFQATDERKISKTKFVFYDSQLHQEAIDGVTNILIQFLVQTKNARDLKKEQTHAWELIVGYSFRAEETQKLDLGADVGLLLRYLNDCINTLPPWLLEKERTSIFKRTTLFASHYQSTGTENNNKEFQKHMAQLVQPLHKLDMLREVLQNFNQTDQDALLLQTKGFQYKIVQDHLKEKTAVMDGDQRTNGHLEWLRSAFSTNTLPYIAEAIKYTSSRIRNEAGLYRRQIFDFLASTVNTIITLSLNNPAESDTLTHVTMITDKLKEMLKNDLSRRDSIGRLSGFKSISASTIQTVATHDPRELNDPRVPELKDLRQLWVSFAVHIDWLQTQADYGEEGLIKYRWTIPVGFSLKSSVQISSISFDRAYPRAQSLNQIARLRQKVDPLEICVDELDKFLMAAEFVTSLWDALNEVWDPKFPCGPVTYESSWCPEKEDISSALLDRLSALFGLSYLAWEEVPLLTMIFDRVFDKLEEAPDYHYRFASGLLSEVLRMYSHSGSRDGYIDSSYFYEIPRLQNAVDKVFRYAVARDMTSQINEWYNAWRTQICDQGLRDFGDVRSSGDVRFLSFLVKYAKKCEPKSCLELLDKADISNRKATLARILLQLSPSALVKQEVMDLLATERQDRVKQVHVGVLDGPFVYGGRTTETEKFLYGWLSPSLLSGFCSSVSRRYANYALTLASDPNASVPARVGAIENFVAAPSTGHQEVMRALQNANIDDPVREAIIIKVFALDSPWHVVSSLLNSSLAKKEQQRMTATLLGHVAKYIQVDKVVQLLGMLLDESRRGKLGMQLHKAIIRMLFDIQTPEATNLLRMEWNKQELPVEIQHIFIEKCVETVSFVGREPCTCEWEWSILKSLFVKKDTPNNVLILLFSLGWRGCNVSNITKFLAHAEHDETLFFLKTQSYAKVLLNDDGARQKYTLLLRALEDASPNQSWSVFSKVYRLLFSINADDQALLDNQDAIEEMKGFLTSDARGGIGDDLNQFATQSLASLIGITCGKSVSCDLKNNPRESIGDICRDNVTAQKFQECVDHFLTKILDTPIREVFSRRLSANAFINLREGFMNSCGSDGYKFWNVLVTKRFKSEISILSEDANLIFWVNEPFV